MLVVSFFFVRFHPLIHQNLVSAVIIHSRFSNPKNISFSKFSCLFPKAAEDVSPIDSHYSIFFFRLSSYHHGPIFIFLLGPFSLLPLKLKKKNMQENVFQKSTGCCMFPTLSLFQLEVFIAAPSVSDPLLHIRWKVGIR